MKTHAWRMSGFFLSTILLIFLVSCREKKRQNNAKPQGGGISRP
ncbi:MAG TPA: hypothetical protein PLP17_01770 [Oligoflexia bacterium]|nr:hypothetical protein [Oligoflexia bacterium]